MNWCIKIIICWLSLISGLTIISSVTIYLFFNSSGWVLYSAIGLINAFLWIFLCCGIKRITDPKYLNHPISIIFKQVYHLLLYLTSILLFFLMITPTGFIAVIAFFYGICKILPYAYMGEGLLFKVVSHINNRKIKL
jgi:hypothetical protein